MRFIRLDLLVVALALLPTLAAAGQNFAPVPPEIASNHFSVAINGHSTPVMHAAQNLYFLNFDLKRKKHVTVSVTADADDFWSKGIEVQPWRLGIRPRRAGRTITFQMTGPAKLSISRPNDFLGDAEMLYLFANVPEKHAPKAAQAGLRYFGPGVHRENIDAASGDRIYLAPGAVVFGALNLWQVSNVQVFGRGVLVYDGPQNPADDDGWMHKRNWHCIVMDQAHEVSIEGITCVVRSRTWQVQMKDSRGITFDNVKIIGANAGNANADGIDWLGGGDTLVKDSFIRAADDVLAMQSSWEGYGPVAFAVQGNPVTNVTVQDSVLSTSISNIVRAGWPEKSFEGGNFKLRNSDVLHMGLGGCGIPFALMEIWADPHGRGRSSGFHFDDVRMEDWYSLTQLMEPVDGISDVSFSGVSGLELPSLVPSLLKGSVSGVSFSNIALGGRAVSANDDLPIRIESGAAQPAYLAGAVQPRIVFPSGLVRSGQKLPFEANLPSGAAAKGMKYEWSFGDGASAKGRKVQHRFDDTSGTLSDGSGRFRVLLHTTDAAGRSVWTYAPVIVTDNLRSAAQATPRRPGLLYRYSELAVPGLPSRSTQEQVLRSGVTATLSVTELRQSSESYGVAFDGFLEVPADGGYQITLLGNDAGNITLDGQDLGSLPAPFAQVCGLAGNAVRQVTGSVALARGLHRISVRETHTTGVDGFRVWWRGPGMPAAQEIPAAALSHDTSAEDPANPTAP